MCVNLVPAGRGVATGSPVGASGHNGWFVTGTALEFETIGLLVGSSVLIVSVTLALFDVCSGTIWFGGSVAITSVGIQVCAENVASVVGTTLAGDEVSGIGMAVFGICNRFGGSSNPLGAYI